MSQLAFNMLDGAGLAHIRFRGISRAVALVQLRVTTASTEAEIRAALSEYLAVGLADLNGHVIERHPSGNITLRPEAIFG